MGRPEYVRCETCVYSHHIAAEWSECRRRSPTSGSYDITDWGIVARSSWCGEWSGSWPAVKEQLDQDPRLPPKVDDVVY